MKNRNSVIFRTSLIGIIGNILLAGFKAAVGLFANSIAIVLDAVNNLTDAISSVITIIGTYFTGKSPDKKHPFGYGRIEYLSTLSIGVLITYAGVTAFIESVKSIITPKTPEYSKVMFLVLVVAVLVKVFLGLFFIKRGKSVKSDSLVASGKDALSDVLISVSTIIAAGVFLIFHLSLEAYLGVLISCLIIKSGFEILKENISKLLGEGASVELVKAVKKTIVEHDGVNGAYDLVFNNYGQDVYLASVHIEIDDKMNANEIDLLCRHLTEDVVNEHNVILTAIGVYSYATDNQKVIECREKVAAIAVAHEHVHQIHGFYLDDVRKNIRFDMVISFDEKNRQKLYEHVIDDIKKEFPEYNISAGMDADFNEI